MNPIAYFLIADLVAMPFIIKAIFKKADVFLKALYIYFYPDLLNSPAPEWEQKNDSNHKMHLFYGCLLALLALNMLMYVLFVNPDIFTARLAG